VRVVEPGDEPRCCRLDGKSDDELQLQQLTCGIHDLRSAPPWDMALFNVPLSCVFFAEFHTVLGPKISYQAPEGFIRADEFESISEYVIPKSQLCGRLVTLYDTIFFMKKKKKRKKPSSNALPLRSRTEEHTIMGVPVMLENKKYDRNAMLFNLGLAFHPDADAKCYEPVARKLADTLRKLEVCGLRSQACPNPSPPHPIVDRARVFAQPRHKGPS